MTILARFIALCEDSQLSLYALSKFFPKQLNAQNVPSLLIFWIWSISRLTAKADAAQCKVITEDPITLLNYVSPFIPAKKSKNTTYTDSAGSRAEHQSKFRAHVQTVMHASEKEHG